CLRFSICPYTTLFRSRKFYFQAHNVMAKAKVLSQFADSESWKDIDAAAFEKALNDSSAALDEAEKYTAANTAEANSASLFNSFIDRNSTRLNSSHVKI